jgi:hypothetical protein
MNFSPWENFGKHQVSRGKCRVDELWSDSWGVWRWTIMLGKFATIEGKSVECSWFLWLKLKRIGGKKNCELSKLEQTRRQNWMSFVLWSIPQKLLFLNRDMMPITSGFSGTVFSNKPCYEMPSNGWWCQTLWRWQTHKRWMKCMFKGQIWVWVKPLVP